MEIVALVLVPIAALVLGFGIVYAVSRREPPPREDLLVSARNDHEERLRSMAERAAAFGRPDAALRVAELVAEQAV